MVLPNSKRDMPETFKTPAIPKKPKSGTIQSRVLSNDAAEDHFIATPRIAAFSKRISLRPEARTSLPLTTFAAKEPTDTEIEEQEDRHVVLSQLEYSNNLKSLHEIMSRSFDPQRAFNYNFISIMSTFINNEQGNVDFKLIGLSLEAGTRVWTSKVDVFLRNTQKVSNSLTMATDDYDGDAEDDGAESLFDQALEGDGNKKKRKPKKKKPASTLVTNLKSLNGKLETNIEVDPLFHHVSAAFDVGNVDSLLMANLSRNPEGAMLLDSNETLDFSSHGAISSGQLELMAFPSTIAFDGICAADIRDFAFNDRTAGAINIAAGTSSEAQTREIFQFDFDAEVEDVDIGFDNFPDDENNDAILAANEDHNESENEDGAAGSSFVDHSGLLGENLRRILPTNENEFFNKNFLKTIFRKVPAFQKIQLTVGNQNRAEPKARKRRLVHQENEYSLEFDEDLFARCKVDAKFTFSREAVFKWVQKAGLFRIKNDYGFTNAWLKCCFCKSNTYFKDLLGDDQQQEANELTVNRNDAFDDDGAGAGDDDFQRNLDHPQVYDLNPTDEIEEDHEPQHVDALDIDYAKVAKKIDMKRVKKAMWDIIEEDASNSQSTLADDTQDKSPSDALTFSALRQTLPDRIHANLNENLSVSTSFVALLHLCNDKNLQLSSLENDDENPFADFAIKMAQD